MIGLAHEHGNHHQGPHHFDPQRFLAMEEWRRSLLPPEVVLQDFLGADDLTLADIGAGTGFFALPAAQRLSRGTVYAVDRQEDMLDVVRRRAQEMDLENLVSLRADAREIPLQDGTVDAVLMANVFHDIPSQDSMLAEVSRILRPDGSFYLVEWEKSQTEFGPPQEIRIAPDDLEQTLARGGFRVERRFPGPSPFYRMLARKA